MRVRRDIRGIGGPVLKPVPHPDAAVSPAGAPDRYPESPVGGDGPVSGGNVRSGPSVGVLEGFVLRG